MKIADPEMKKNKNNIPLSKLLAVISI